MNNFLGKQGTGNRKQSRLGLLTQQHGLQKILKDKKCFKLICGAGNENLDEVEKLVALYAKAGCHFFDLSASQEVLAAAQKGLDFAIPKKEQGGYHFCVSIGTKNDQHMQKAQIDENKCQKCGKCIEICPQNAIEETVNGKQETEVVEKNCIGCLRCQEVCKFDAISFHFSPFIIPYCLPFTVYRSLSCIELHASDTNEQEVDEIWEYLTKNFNGMLSLCIGRSKLGNEQILDRIKRLIKDRKPYSTIIQADGVPMSGGEDDFKTTLQAVAMAEIIQNANLPVYVLLSGGTNSKTAELAKLCGVNFNGIGIGSFARKIVKKYIEQKDFLENKVIFEEALKIARNLIKSTDVI